MQLCKLDHTVKVLHTCQIHTNITAVVQKIILSSFTIFFANFYVVVFIITISKFCGFASVIGEK